MQIIHCVMLFSDQRAHIPKAIMTVLEKDAIDEQKAVEKARRAEEERMTQQEKLYQVTNCCCF